jgi:hypothetical protein
MTSKYLAAFALLILTLRSYAGENKPDPVSLVHAANNVGDLSRAVPYQLTGTVILNPGTVENKRGSIAVYRDHDQYRSDIEISGQRRTWIKLGNKVYVADSSPFAFMGLEKLKDIENAWQETWADNKSLKFSQASRKKKLGAEVWCLTANYQDYVPENLCFDAALKVMVSTGQQDDVYEFSDFQSLGGQLYPGIVRRYKRGKVVLEVRDIRVQSSPVPPNSFHPPDSARAFDDCENMVMAKLKSSADILPRNTLSPGERVTIFAYGIIREDGTVADVKVTSIPSNPAIINFAEGVLSKRRYTPAMCGDRPVASELVTEFEAVKSN